MSSFHMGGAGIGDQFHHGAKRLYGNPNPPYDVYEGEGPPPDGYALIASPGSPVPADYVARYNLADKLKPADGAEPPQLRSSVNNEPLVMVGGRAVAESSAPEHLRPSVIAAKQQAAKGQPGDRNTPAPAPGQLLGPQAGGSHAIEQSKPGQAAAQADPALSTTSGQPPKAGEPAKGK